MRVILNHGALKSTLPDMTQGMVPLVTTPGVAYREGLEDLTYRLPKLRLEQEMKVIGHETRAEEAKRIAFFGLGESQEEGDAVGAVAEDVSAVVAAIEGLIDEAVIDGARSSSHDSENNDWRASRHER